MADNEIKGVNELVNDIKANLKQKSSSNRDEARVMRAMLNDRDFTVTTYSNSGTETHCPAEEFRGMLGNIVSATAKLPKAEAENLVNNYEVKKSDAETMIGISKDFINTSLRTGRKIQLGGTESSNISVQLKEIPESIKRYPKKVGVNQDNSTKYENAETRVPAHEGLKVTSPCPDWVTKKK
jgi:hypothetical protein